MCRQAIDCTELYVLFFVVPVMFYYHNTQNYCICIIFILRHSVLILKYIAHFQIRDPFPFPNCIKGLRADKRA